MPNSYHFLKGTQLICEDGSDEIRLRITFFGLQTVYLNGLEVSKMKSMKLRKEQHFEQGGNHYSIRSFPINGQVSATDYEFRKNEKLLKVFRTRNDFNGKKMTILFAGIFLISLPILIYKLPDYVFWLANLSYLILFIILFANSFIKIEIFDNEMNSVDGL